MVRTEKFYLNSNSDDNSKNYVKNHHAGKSTERIADSLNITDYISTISNLISKFYPVAYYHGTISPV